MNQAAAETADEDTAMSAPTHVVIISLDTLRADCIGASPAKLWPRQHRVPIELHTTVLDELTANGAFFANCISAAPYTSASHATYFTGKWPLRHGVFELFNRRLQGQTIFHRAARLGYRTVMKVDFPLILGPHLGFTDAVDHYLVEDDEGFLASLTGRERLLAFAHFGGIHVPYGFHNLRFGGRAFIDKVRELEADLPDSACRAVVGAFDPVSENGLLLRYKNALQHHYAEGNYDRLFTLYIEGLNHFLETRFRPFLERVLDLLAGRHALLVLFGDHGEEYDEESYGHQGTLAEGVLRVPLIFYGEGCARGTYLDRVRTIDLAPTLLEALGDRQRHRLRLDGESLLEPVRTGAVYPLRPAYAQTYMAEDGAYLAFVKRLMYSGQKTGALKHVLYKECVYEGAAKVTRRLCDCIERDGAWRYEPCDPEVRTERCRPDLCWERVDDPSLEQRLCKRLDEYNLLRPGGDGAVGVTDEMRAQLQAMGYRL